MALERSARRDESGGTVGPAHDGNEFPPGLDLGVGLRAAPGPDRPRRGARGTGFRPFRAELYDGFYARYGGARLDVETLLRAAGSLLRGDDRLPENEDEQEALQGGRGTPSAREG